MTGQRSARALKPDRSRNVILMLFALLAGGCSTVEYGAYYDSTVHGRVGEAGGTIFVYVDSSVENGIVYQTWLNRKTVGKVYPGTFISNSVEPGSAELNFQELRANFEQNPETLDFEFPPKMTDLFYPKKHVQILEVGPGEDIYFHPFRIGRFICREFPADYCDSESAGATAITDVLGFAVNRGLTFPPWHSPTTVKLSAANQ